MTNIKEHSANGKSYLIVQLEKETGNYQIIDSRLFLDTQEVRDDYDLGIDLPKGNYKLLFTASQATEEQAGEVVRNNGMNCFDNYMGISDNVYTLLTAKKSLDALIQSLFHDVHNSFDYLIIEIL